MIDRAKDTASAWLDHVRPLRSPCRFPPLLPVVPSRPNWTAGRRPIRVLMQVENFDRGGLERVVVDLAHRLPAASFDVQILALGRCGAAAEMAGGLRVLTLPDGVERLAAYRRLIEGRFDVVNAHASLFGADVASTAGVAFVQTIHGSYVWADDAEAARMRAADTHTTAYLCVSSTAANYTAGRFGIARQKLRVCRNGVDVDRWRPSTSASRDDLRRDLGLTREDFVVLTSGSITTIKGQLPLVRALPRALAVHPRLRLLFAGGTEDARYVRRVRSAIRTAGLADSVVFAGHLADAQAAYHAADAFVQPSFAEGWSLALGEAAAVGLPLIATNVGAAGEIVPAAEGRLVRLPFDPLAFEPRSFAAMSRRRHPAFEAALAEALCWAAGAPRRAGVTDELRRLIDVGPAIDDYGQALAEIADG